MGLTPPHLDSELCDNYLQITSAHEKVCVRCGKRFTVFPNGKYASREECVYHWGKCWKRKGNIKCRQ